MAVGSAERVPNGEMPPTTYPVARSASAGSAIAARLRAHRRRERLEVQAPAHRHDRDDQALVDAGDQRLEDAVGREAERRGGLFAVRRRRRIVVVGVQLEGRSGAGQSDGRGCAACRGAALLAQLGLTAARVQLHRRQRGQQPEQDRLPAQDRQFAAQPARGVGLLEQPLLVAEVEDRGRGDQVGQHHRVVGQLVRVVGRLPGQRLPVGAPELGDRMARTAAASPSGSSRNSTSACR